MADSEFTHHISREQYIEGLEAELRSATVKEHKAAIVAELDGIRGTKAVAAGAPEQA